MELLQVSLVSSPLLQRSLDQQLTSTAEIAEDRIETPRPHTAVPEGSDEVYYFSVAGIEDPSPNLENNFISRYQYSETISRL